MPSPRSFRVASAAALTAALPLASVAAFPILTFPAAVAADASQCRAVSSASMAWGVKQSLRNYLSGPIAGGGWDMAGVTYSGTSKNSADGVFNFTAIPEKSVVSGDAADLPMSGTLHFTGHGGIINVTLSNFELQIRGNRAQLLADGRYLAADPGAIVSLVGGPPAFTRQPVATFTLDRTLTQAGAASGTATFSGSSWIHENLNKGLLGNYGAGENDGDPVTITVATAGSSDCSIDANASMATSPGQTDTVAPVGVTATPAESPSAPISGNQTQPGVGAGTTNDPGTCEALTGASAGWGLKQSFRKYLTGPIAMGNWQLNDVAFAGEKAGADGQFQFTANPSAVRISGADADIPLKGSMKLTGHLGALEINYSNMRVKVRGTTAQFIADYRSSTVSSFTAGAEVTGAKTGTQIAIAQFTLAQPISAAAANTGSIALAGPGFITEDGNQSLGGNYGEGNNEADPINISLKTTGAGCGIGTGAGLGAIATAGQATSGGSGVSTGTPDLGITPRVSGTATTAVGDSDLTCSAENSERKVVESRMGWGFKEAFRSYIKGSIANGTWTPTGGAVYSQGNFVFTGSTGTVSVVNGSVTSGTLKYGGSVLFTGHGTTLRVLLSNPEIRINGSAGTVVANVESNDTNGKSTNYGRIALANLSVASASVANGILDGSASATLTADGATALDGYYGAGESMDPVSFKASLSADCSSDSAASLGDKPEDESTNAANKANNKVTVTNTPEDEDKDTGLVAFLKDPASMVPSLIAVIAAAAAGVMGVRLRRTNRRIEEVAAAAGLSTGEPGDNS